MRRRNAGRRPRRPAIRKPEERREYEAKNVAIIRMCPFSPNALVIFIPRLFLFWGDAGDRTRVVEDADPYRWRENKTGLINENAQQTILSWSGTGSSTSRVPSSTIRVSRPPVSPNRRGRRPRRPAYLAPHCLTFFGLHSFAKHDTIILR